MIGDLGAYGRYKEAKKLAGADKERTRRNRYEKPQYPTITGTVLSSLRRSAIEVESQTVWTDKALLASLAIMGQGLFAGIGHAIVERDIFVGISRLGVSEAVALGPLAAQAIVRRYRMHKLAQDAVVAGE